MIGNYPPYVGMLYSFGLGRLCFQGDHRSPELHCAVHCDRARADGLYSDWPFEVIVAKTRDVVSE